jgi:pimeloyl-ACP methyl ester carboxylesterase
MLVELVQVITRDGVRLDGAYQAPQKPAAGVNIDAFVLVHGTGGNFYSSTLFDVLAEALLALGVAVLRVNTRGHDLMSTAATSRGGARLGAAHEVVHDCRHDLAAWIDHLKQHGASRRIGLLGHSLGAVKCMYAQASDPDPAVTRLVAISPPLLSFARFHASEKGAEFMETYQRARMLVDAGEPDALLDVRLPLPFVVTAAGYVEKYGPDERYNYLRFIDRVGCPALLTLGEVEAAQNMAFRGAAAAVVQAAPGVLVETVAGADHFYTGVRDRLAACVESWLRAPETDPGSPR